MHFDIIDKHISLWRHSEIDTIASDAVVMPAVIVVSEDSTILTIGVVVSRRTNEHISTLFVYSGTLTKSKIVLIQWTV